MNEVGSEVNTTDVGSITGLIRLEMTQEDKDTLVEFVESLLYADKVQGENTKWRMENLSRYLQGKLHNKHIVIEAETCHIVWLFMGAMIKSIDPKIIDHYTILMNKLADGLDKKAAE